MSLAVESRDASGIVPLNPRRPGEILGPGSRTHTIRSPGYSGRFKGNCPQDKAGFSYGLDNHMVLASFLHNLEQYETIKAFQDSLTPIKPEVNVAPLEKEVYQYQLQKKRLLDLVVDGTVSMDDVKKKISQIQSEIDAAESSIQTARQDAVSDDSYAILDALAEDTVFSVFDSNPDQAKLFYERLLKCSIAENGVLEIRWLNGATHKIDVDKPSRMWSNRISRASTYYQGD